MTDLNPTSRWSNSSRWNRRWGALVFCSGLLLGLVPILRGRTFFHWDNAQQHLAQTTFLHDGLRARSLPQWWPDVGMGVPTVAEGQSAHFHPFRVLVAALFEPVHAMSIEVGLYLGLGGLATFLFLRELRLLGPAAAFGAFAHMFGGFSLVFLRNLALHRSMFLLPLMLLLAERTARRPGRGVVLVLAAVFGLQLLSGHPTYGIVSVVAASTYLVVRLSEGALRRREGWSKWTRRFAESGWYWGIGLAAGVGVGAVQLIPTLAHIPLSIREGGLAFDYAAKSLTAGFAWMGQMVLPYAYEQGDLRSLASVGAGLFNQAPSRGFYLGALIPVLSLPALLRRRGGRLDPRVVVLIVTLLVCFTLALGGRTPLFAALRSLPGMAGLRYPQRFLGPCSVLIAALAAIGLQEALRVRRRGSRGVRSRIRVAVGVYAVSALALAASFVVAVERLHSIWLPAADFPQGLLWSLVLVTFAGSWVWLIVGRRLPVAVASLGCVAFLVADLLVFRVQGQYARTVPIEEVVAVPEAVQHMRTRPGQSGRVLSLQSADGGALTNQVLREYLVADLPSIWGVRTTDVYFSLMLRRHFPLHESIVWEMLHEVNAAAALAPFLGAMNVRFVVAPAGLELGGFDKVFSSGQVALWENPKMLPQDFVVFEIEPETIEVRPIWAERAGTERLPGYRAMVADWSSRIPDVVLVDNIMDRAIDFSMRAVVAGEVELGGASLASGRPRAATVSVLEDRSDTRTVRVTTPRPGLFIWSQTYYPGWTATMDGEPVDIVRANYLTMGVVMPAGTHELVFRFVTPYFRVGLLVSVATCIGLVMFGLVDPGRRRAGV